MAGSLSDYHHDQEFHFRVDTAGALVIRKMGLTKGLYLTQN
jgi:hypothetical protein